VLTVTTGLVDAVSVLGLGRVFTANMTGNVVFLGFAAVGVPGFSVARAVVALAGFMVGALLGGRLGVAMAGMACRRWLLTVAVVEAGCCFVAAWVASGYDLVTLTPGAHALHADPLDRCGYGAAQCYRATARGA
jgi:uncharacterized membrane protein YoaK (UPF0700 family)